MEALVCSAIDTPLKNICKSVRELSSFMRRTGIHQWYILIYHRWRGRIDMNYMLSHILQNYLTLPMTYLYSIRNTYISVTLKLLRPTM